MKSHNLKGVHSVDSHTELVALQISCTTAINLVPMSYTTYRKWLKEESLISWLYTLLTGCILRSLVMLHRSGENSYSIQNKDCGFHSFSYVPEYKSEVEDFYEFSEKVYGEHCKIPCSNSLTYLNWIWTTVPPLDWKALQALLDQTATRKEVPSV